MICSGLYDLAQVSGSSLVKASIKLNAVQNLARK